MSSYSRYDFSESCKTSGVDPKTVKSVLAAWGENGMCAEWTGGFLLECIDGQFAYLTGWCDTTGWGCQDGGTLVYYETRPDLATLEPRNRVDAWDETPADLNSWLAAGAKDTETWE